MIELNKEYTYQQICEELGWKVQTGKSKQIHIKEIESCYEFYHPENKKTHKPKKSYIFTKQLKEPVEPSRANNGGARNTKNITPMIQFIKVALNEDDLNEFYSFSDWYSYKLDLMDNVTGSMIYKDMEEIEAFCSDYGIRNAELFKDYVSSARTNLKRIFLKALERMEKDNECIYNLGYKFIYQLGKRTTGYVSTNELNEKIKEIETIICNEMNEAYHLSTKMTGRQLLMIIYNKRDYKEKLDERKVEMLMNDKEAIDKLNDVILDTHGFTASGIDDKKPLINCYPALIINDIDFEKGDINTLATEVTKIICAKAKKEILNKHIKLKDKNGNVYDRIYKYTDFSDRNDIKKIEKIFYKHLDTNLDMDEFSIDADTSEIDDIMSIPYNDIWVEPDPMEHDFSVEEILDMVTYDEYAELY